MVENNVFNLKRTLASYRIIMVERDDDDLWNANDGYNKKGNFFFFLNYSEKVR